ncbi:MAG: hypothetical protein QOC70_2463 [Verrucomicrobiota bacterium]|jgi:hypothetical protein
MLVGLMTGVAVILSVAGCWKKSGQAVILEKEYIAAKEIPPTPTASTEQSASPSTPTPASSELASQKEEGPQEVRADEIVVDTYVMKKDARGTGRDPRAMGDEQWMVWVQTVDDLRRIKVQTDRAHWEKAKVGNRVKVSYREGKYTGTVWSAEIE